jgi:putative sigma-54 modulation protein
MQINVTGHQMDVTEPLRAYAHEKIGRIHKHFDHVIATNVVLHVQKNQHKAEATIHAGGASLSASAEAGDMYAALDALADKLDRQVLRHKEKIRDHHRTDAVPDKQSS